VKLSKAGEFEEDKHPRDKTGKFGSGSGTHERTADSLKDAGFVTQHMSRLSGAADRVRDAAPAEERGTDAVHNAAQAAIHHEASLIHHEDDAAASDPHADRLKGALDEARDSGKGHEATMDHLAAAHKEAEDEHAAAAAGHVNLDHEALKPAQEWAEAKRAADAESEAAADDLLPHNQKAADALADFKATDGALEEHDEKHKTLDSDLESDLRSTAESFDHDFEDREGPDVPEVRTPENDLESTHPGDASKRSDFANDAEFEADQKNYEEAKADHDKNIAEHTDHASDIAALKTEHKARAEKAQDALEALHEKQHAALEAFKDRSVDKLKAKAEKALDKVNEDADGNPDLLVNHKAFAEHEHESDEFDENNKTFTDERVQADYDRARSVAQSVVSRYNDTLQNDEGSKYGTEDQIDAIKEAAKSTAHAIKHMAKITGRPAKLAGVKAKKSNRPGSSSAASVAPMARYKLKLSKLDFVSLVDQPAQGTATCRLIKRAGGTARVQAKATAQLLKVADGPNPLAYFWAFTCTDETGQPYHDLQGDAIEPDAYIQAAEDFMSSGGGGVDEMHDSQQTGRVAFAFPMDGEIAKAMFGSAAGDLIKTSGLMVALRPTAAQVAKLRSGELTGVSIAGNGIRELAKRATSRVSKSSVVATSVEEGHAHTIDLCAPTSCWGGSLSTSCQTSAGEEQSHTHAWTYDESGVVTILPDSGHTHTVEGVVSPEVMAEAAADDDEDDKSCAPCATEDKPSGPTVVVVSARAPGLSTRPGAVPTVKSKEQLMPTAEETKIAELTKSVERLTALSKLNDSQREYHSTLSLVEGTAFLAKSATERAAIVEPIEVAKRAANEIVYTSAGGESFRKSDDPRLVAMAKRLDSANAATEQVTLEKRASTDLSHFAKSLGVKAAIVKALDGIADESVRKEALEAVRGANTAMQMLGKSNGFVPVDGPQLDDPAAKLDVLAKKYEADNKVSYAKAYDAVLATSEGVELYKSMSTPRAN
jgi:Putative phage serine protease XkdF